MKLKKNKNEFKKRPDLNLIQKFFVYLLAILIILCIIGFIVLFWGAIAVGLVAFIKWAISYIK
jgi:uncharacterized membrane protein